MSDTREMLIALIAEKQDCGLTHNAKGRDFVTYNEELADHLIANGVTTADKREAVGDKLSATGAAAREWISVKDRLPNEPLQTILVTNGKEVCVGVYSVIYEEFGVMCGVKRSKPFGATHWMPLPEPPGGE